MTQSTRTNSSESKVEAVMPERSVGAIVLVAIGVIIVISRLIPGTGDYVLLASGLACLVAFLYTREYGYAVAAGIVTGFGVGVILSTYATDPNDGMVFMLSVAGGFLAVWILGFFADPPERNPWPLVPAIILAALGISIATDTPGLIDWLIVAFAIVLVLAGLRTFRAHRTEEKVTA